MSRTKSSRSSATDIGNIEDVVLDVEDDRARTVIVLDLEVIDVENEVEDN